MAEHIDSTTEIISPRQFPVALVSAPWALFHRPSIQLASLRAYLQEKGGYQVESHHLYLSVAQKISIELYSRITNSSWAGEALFAPLLFPEKKEEAARLFHSELRGDGKGTIPDFDGLVSDLKDCCDTWISRIVQKNISLIGFSVCFSQLLSSLYLASQIKKIKSIPIVFGGTSCSGDIGRSLGNKFNQIDYVIDGEGEEPLLELCNFLSEQRTTIPAQVYSQKGCDAETKIGDIRRLDDLPMPDFLPYLDEVRQIFSDLPFMPILPVEFSRGCSWNRCTFCNLNLQWQGYRWKSAERMIAEIQELSVRTESLNFSFTDNLLPEREMDTFFQAIISLGHDFNFFGEIRAKTPQKRIALYRRGGMKEVQAGIESLSTTLLSRMGKGTTVMDNLAVMKYCSAVDLRLLGNIITEFPGTSEEEIEETLVNLDYVLPYAPLDIASFFLGFGSPIYKEPAKFGISACVVHPKNRALFPAKYRDILLISGFRGDKMIQEKRWQPVRKKIKAWQNFHHNRSASATPPLYYRDGDRYLVIYQELQDNSTLLHRLRGISRKLYLYCDEPKKVDEIYTAFSDLSSEAIEGFIQQLCNKRLMFREADRILALAIPPFK